MNTCPHCGSIIKAKPVAVVPLPLATPTFLAAWGDWLTHLNQKRKPPTMLAQGRQLKKLEAMGIERAVATLEHCIEKDWRGIYEVQEQVVYGGGKPASAKPQTIWSLKQQLEAAEAEIRDIKGRGIDHPLGWQADSEADRLRLKALREKQKQLRTAMNSF